MFNPEVKDYIACDEIAFEDLPLINLVKEKQLACYKQSDFWKPMDTIHEEKELNEIWESKNAPWKIWQ